MPTQHFFLRNKLLATSEAVAQPPFYTKPHGYAFFCPICAEVWFRCLVEGEASACTQRFCERHEPGEKVGNWSFGHVWNTDYPGSVWTSWDNALILNLPEPVLRRELNLMIAYWERYQCNL